MSKVVAAIASSISLDKKPSIILMFNNNLFVKTIQLVELKTEVGFNHVARGYGAGRSRVHRQGQITDSIWFNAIWTEVCDILFILPCHFFIKFI